MPLRWFREAVEVLDFSNIGIVDENGKMKKAIEMNDVMTRRRNSEMN